MGQLGRNRAGVKYYFLYKKIDALGDKDASTNTVDYTYHSINCFK